MIDVFSHRKHGTARSTLSRRSFLGCAASLGAAATAASAEDGTLFLLTLEEHFATPELQRLNRVRDERLFSGGGRRPNSSTWAPAGSRTWIRRASACRCCRP